MKYLDIVKLKY